MATPKLNYERAAQILITAIFFSPAQAVKQHGVSDRTINNYKNRLERDEKLAELFRQKKEAFEQNWLSGFAAAMHGGAKFITKATLDANHTDPDMVHAVAGAMKILAEIGLTKDIIDARLGRLDRPDGEEGGSVATLSAETE